MSDRPTIEDVLDVPRTIVAIMLTDLQTATADGPIRSEDGTLVVHRADPELEDDLRYWADDAEAGCDHNVDPDPGCCHYRYVAHLMRRAAALLAGDPEEES